MEKLVKAIKKIDLNAVNLAHVICDIMIAHYGKHNFKGFVEVINNRLK